MKHLVHLVILTTVSFAQISCSETESKKDIKRTKALEECYAETDNTQAYSFGISGLPNIKQVNIKEIFDGKVLNERSIELKDSTNKQADGRIILDLSPLDMKNSYQIITNDGYIFALSNFKKDVAELHGMFSYVFACHITQYKLNEKLYQTGDDDFLELNKKNAVKLKPEKEK